MQQRDFDAFYLGSRRRLTVQLYALTGDWEEAQDCVQEAFAKAWAQRRTIDQLDQPEAWVRKVAYRMAVSRWRRAATARRPADRAVALPTESLAPSADHVALVAALRRLPEAQRRALVLHHLVDLPVATVAAETGVSEGTVKARLSRGRAALAALMSDDPTPEPTAGNPDGVTA